MEAGFFKVLVSAIGALWGVFKSSDWWAERKRRKFSAAIEVLELGVERTYQSYVRHLKDKNQDGKLSEEERKHARRKAIATAKEFARTRGVRLARTLGRDALNEYIEAIVRKAKLGPIPPKNGVSSVGLGGSV